MSPFDRDVLAERAVAVDRHLRRMADRLPASPGELRACLHRLSQRVESPPQ